MNGRLLWRVRRQRLHAYHSTGSYRPSTSMHRCRLRNSLLKVCVRPGADTKKAPSQALQYCYYDIKQPVISCLAIFATGRDAYFLLWVPLSRLCAAGSTRSCSIRPNHTTPTSYPDPAPYHLHITTLNPTPRDSSCRSMPPVSSMSPAPRGRYSFRALVVLYCGNEGEIIRACDVDPHCGSRGRLRITGGLSVSDLTQQYCVNKSCLYYIGVVL